MAQHVETLPTRQLGEHYYAGKIDQDPINRAWGVLAAVDVKTGPLRWEVESAGSMLADVTAAAGDLNGNVFFVNAENGKVRLRHPLAAYFDRGQFETFHTSVFKKFPSDFDSKYRSIN